MSTAKKLVRLSLLLFSIFLPCSAFPLSAAVLPGDLLVGNLSTTTGTNFGEILDINPKTGSQTVVTSGGYIGSPTALCLDSSGNLIVAAQLDTFGDGIGAIIRVNLATGQQTLLTGNSSPLSVIESIKALPNGDFIFAEDTSTGPGGSLDLFDPSNGSVTQIATGSNLEVITGVVVEPDGNYLVANFQSFSGIVRVNGQTGAQSVLASRGYFNLGPLDEALNNTQPNSLLVAESVFGNPSSSGLINVNTITGAETAISLGGDFNTPDGVAQDLLGDTYVLDQNNGKSFVATVSLNTGAQNIISSGGLLNYADGIVVAVPEPGSSAVVLGIAFIFIVQRRRRLNDAPLFTR